jgi:hypothetical protein
LSTLYLCALAGVCAILLGVLLEAIVAVSRKPVWTAPRRSLTLVPPLDRRTQQLPFVGVDRRGLNVGEGHRESA